MGKIKKKGKEIIQPATKLTKVSNYKTTLKAKKVSKVKKEKQIKADSPKQKVVNKKVFTYNIEQFRKGIDALLQYEEQYDSKDLFTREKPLFLQIDSVKIPICPSRRIRLHLKHSLLTDKQEVCLIVPDLKRGRREDHEPTIEHYEELLRSQNVTIVKRIIPIRQLRVEYDQFELKRRLCGYYDYFLVAGNISGHVLHLLGKIFIEKRKVPVPIKLDEPNLAATIENALKKASLHIHPQGSSFIVQFGHSEMTPEQLTDNLKSVADRLITDFPGGWANIRSLHIRTDRSIGIPVYYTLKSANTVNVPVIKPIRPKMFEKVTGELTTKVANSSITVHPGGKVDYNKRQIGISKNQLRKIKQGKIQKRSAKIRANSAKRKAKQEKRKLAVKTEEIKQEKKKLTVKTEAKQTKEIKSGSVKKQIKTGESLENSKEKTKKKQKRVKSQTDVKQVNETVAKKQKKVKKTQSAIEQVPSETSAKKQKKTKKQKKETSSKVQKISKGSTENAKNDKKRTKQQKLALMA